MGVGIGFLLLWLTHLTCLVNVGPPGRLSAPQTSRGRYCCTFAPCKQFRFILPFHVSYTSASNVNKSLVKKKPSVEMQSCSITKEVLNDENAVSSSSQWHASLSRRSWLICIELVLTQLQKWVRKVTNAVCLFSFTKLYLCPMMS